MGEEMSGEVDMSRRQNADLTIGQISGKPGSIGYRTVGNSKEES